jgi:hypothetical protein
MNLPVDELTLDQRLTDLRHAVNVEIERARRELIGSFSGALAKMRSAANESEWNAAVMESGRAFSGDSAALDFLASLAAMTAPAHNQNSEPGVNLTAQRFAKVKIAEIQLYQAPAVKAGRSARDLYGSLKPHIDSAREAFKERFITPGSEIADYLHAELVRALANDDATLLGPGYPGPLA